MPFQSTLPARGATGGIRRALRLQTISIHAPRTGSDTDAASVPPGREGFQSTLPARGATYRRTASPPLWQPFQSTLPARGATKPQRRVLRVHPISIHAPRTGSDDGDAGRERAEFAISIHAPRTGSDPQAAAPRPSRPSHFNPRSPHGERRLPAPLAALGRAISIHAPRTGSDERLVALLLFDGISIHAPRTGSDSAK